MKEVNQDITSADVDVIVQQNNCTSITTLGLSRHIREMLNVDIYATRRPVIRDGKFLNIAVDADRSIPGTIRIDKAIRADNANIYVAGLFAQYHPGKPLGLDSADRRHTWFVLCLNQLSVEMRQRGLKRVAIPRYIGCGLAGGDWTLYRDSICCWTNANVDIDVSIYYL